MNFFYSESNSKSKKEKSKFFVGEMGCGAGGVGGCGGH